MKWSFVFTAAFVGTAAGLAPAETIRVIADNTRIDKSCTIEIPEGTVIVDADGNGVIHVAADDIEIRFAPGTVLRGAPADRRPDEYRGYGIRIEGQDRVTLKHARVHGYWSNIYATDADRLVLEKCDASDARRAFLKSTPVAEDSSDWLSPHHNAKNEWLTNYGAAIYIEDADNITVRQCRVRDSQNGLILDNVDDSRIYDNDFSFLSGWGLALWKCDRNIITRNALDFCIRGYSHGVYNRGQDSAGILMFELNNENVIAENSATHGGDGFFGFAGREALGEDSPHPAEWYRRKGNNDNLLIANDFSYAAAHGIEMTFSFGNQFLANRLVGNAICGVWGGYSQDTLIALNTFEENGDMGYGLERGGVNIEHGRGNRILQNEFRRNRCGVHLWWDPEGDFLEKPWGKANGSDSKENLIAANRFVNDQTVFHFRGPSAVTLCCNEILSPEKEMEREPNVEVMRADDMTIPKVTLPDYEVLGTTRPVGARSALYDRENIIMTEWGPWDHEAPLARLAEARADAHVYELHKYPSSTRVSIEGDGVRLSQRAADSTSRVPRYIVEAKQSGVAPYTLVIDAGAHSKRISATLIAVRWTATFFKWDDSTDPRNDLESWRALAKKPDAVTVETDRMTFKYAFGGPSEQKLSDALTNAKIGGDRYGMTARAQVPLAAGTWKISTVSDDGIRVLVDGKPVVEDWTWHPPKRNDGTFTLDRSTTVEIMVEHFEIDGFATLEFELSRG